MRASGASLAAAGSSPASSFGLSAGIDWISISSFSAAVFIEFSLSAAAGECALEDRDRADDGDDDRPSLHYPSASA